MMMQQRMNMKGATILCLNTYAEHLSNFAVCATFMRRLVPKSHC
jgi:hypothetical protein